MDPQYGSASEEKASMANPPPYPDPPQMGYPQPGQPQFGGYGYSQQPYPGQQPYQGQPYPGQVYPAPGQVVIAVQPTHTPLSPPEKDYLGYSIFTLLCCCMPLGIAALIYSILTRDANRRGDQGSAEQNSRTALKLNHWSVGLGIVCFIIIIILVIVTESEES